MKLFILLTILLISPLIEERTLPTAKFQQAVAYFEKDYKTTKSKCAAEDEYNSFVRTSANGYWTYGSKRLRSEVWQVKLKGKKEIEPNTYSRVTITEFQFGSAKEAGSAAEVIKEFSEEKWKMKTMNNYFIHGSCIYLVETDAVMFEKDYNSVTSRLKKYLEV